MEHSCSGSCSSCGSCGSCGSCANTLLLSEGEIAMLKDLGQLAFLPVARKADDMTPVYLEDTCRSREEYSLILQLLEKKGLIDLDYERPLAGSDMSAYAHYPVHGTVGLTARGQAVLEAMELQGIEPA